MGTNYYLVKIQKCQRQYKCQRKTRRRMKKRQQQIHQRIKRVQHIINKKRAKVEKRDKDNPQQFHVGKSSVGSPFTFCFDFIKKLNPQFYQKIVQEQTATRAEIEQFFRQLVESKTYKIIDEYGESREFDEFWKFILIKNEDRESVNRRSESDNFYKYYYNYSNNKCIDGFFHHVGVFR